VWQGTDQSNLSSSECDLSACAAYGGHLSVTGRHRLYVSEEMHIE